MKDRKDEVNTVLLIAPQLQPDWFAGAEDFARRPASCMIFDIINRCGYRHRNMVARTPWPLTWRITGLHGALPARTRLHRLAHDERAAEP
jgi:hypothetical protein